MAIRNRITTKQYHLMIEAGLATGTDVSAGGGTSPEAMLQSLTWEGHEFVEAARVFAERILAQPGSSQGQLRIVSLIRRL